MSMEKYIELTAAAKQLGTSYYILREETKRGRLAAYKIGKKVLTTEAELERYIQACRIEQTPRAERRSGPGVKYIPGMRIGADGSVSYPDGRIVRPDGTVERKPGRARA